MTNYLSRSLALAASVLVAVAGCAGGEESAESSPTAPSTTEPPATPEQTAPSPTEPAPGPTTSDEPTESDTSRENPAPPGTPVTVQGESGTWEISLGEPDRATAQAQIEEGWVEIDEDETLLIVPVSATYSGEGNASVTSDVNFGYVTATGETYPADPLGPLGADPLMDVGDVFDGGIAQGNLMFVVPKSAEPGVWWLIDFALQTPGEFIEAPPATEGD